MVFHTCRHSTQEAEAGGLQVPGQPGLYNEREKERERKRERVENFS
jgi:hypothetical protein